MAISASDVKELRERSGAGMLECKKALEEAGGDMDKAMEALKKKGHEMAEKRGERETAEGAVHSYIHHNHRVGALVEVNCESDFVARTDDFKALVAAVALQVAGKPETLYVTKDELPSGSKDDPKAVVLLEQPFIKDESITIGEMVRDAIAKTGENIRIKRFARFELGR
ncbi:MAG TPA: translation elongation factor Ts [Dehalococcoidia bacterium]|nr:translation elongation factor Ts [Dehalococcoidia bacterium]